MSQQWWDQDKLILEVMREEKRAVEMTGMEEDYDGDKND